MLVSCRGCGGTGTMRLKGRYNAPVSWNEFNCPGCGGDGKVNVPDPSVFCQKCTGRGIIFVKAFGSFDQSGGHDEHCPGCGGHGYAT